MSGLSISFDGHELNILVADLTTAPLRARVECALAVRKTARRIESEAKRIVPVASAAEAAHSGAVVGLLRDSIHSHVSGLSGYVRASTRYAAYVEYGTSEMAPEPYMRPAALVGYSVLAEGAADAGEHAILR